MLDIPYRHSLSSNYLINNSQSLACDEVVSFRLSDGNKIYINKKQLTQQYGLNQDIENAREEIQSLVIAELNRQYDFSDCTITKLEKLFVNEENISEVKELKVEGFPLSNTFIDTYIQNVDVNIGHNYFPLKNEKTFSEIDVSIISFDINLYIGSLFLDTKNKIKKNEIYILRPQYHGIINGDVVFDFLLGLDEILVINKGYTMSLETTVGEPLIPDPSGVHIEIEVSLGSIKLSLAELQSLVVGDFINLQELSTNQIELRMKNTLIAHGELVYDENKQLSVEVKEVFI
jgi:hypothetical protein